MSTDLYDELNTQPLATNPNGNKSKNDDINTPNMPINDQRDPTKFPPEESPPGEPIMPKPPQHAPQPDSSPEIVPPSSVVPGEIPTYYEKW